MATLIAVDPGDVYVGVAQFEQAYKNDVSDLQFDPPYSQDDWKCIAAVEFSPNEFADGLAMSVFAGDYDYVVYERFRLYGDKAAAQTGSEFLTSQLIGVMKWITRQQNEHARRHQLADEQGGVVLDCEQVGGVCSVPRKIRPVSVIAQMADIKVPTRGILNARKIKSIARPIARELYNGRDHVVDAELHGWHYILNGMYKENDRDPRAAATT